MSKINNEALQCIKTYIEEIGNHSEKIISEGLSMIKKGTKYCCPDSLSHKNGDKNPSMAWDSNKHMFYCFTCGKSINIYQFYKDYQSKNFIDIIPEHIRKSNTDVSKKNKKELQNTQKKEINNNNHFKDNLKILTAENRKYLNNRGINDETLKLFKIVSTNKNNPAFPYFNNQMQISGIKYRTNFEDAKYMSFKNSDFTLFGRHLCKKSKENLIVVEGEIDCMLIKQLFPEKNVVSVPTGANSLESLFKKEKEFFTQYSNIFVCPDNDDAGKRMLIKFEKEFENKVTCVDFKRYKNENDISDLYNNYGIDGIQSLIRTSISHDIVDMSELDIEPEDNYYLDTGYPTLDDTINGIMGGTTTAVCGYTGHGKTTFIEAFVNKVIGEGYKVLTIDGEHRKLQKTNNTYLKVLSDLKDNKKEFIEEIQIHRKLKLYPNKEGKRLCKAWSKNKNFLYSVADIEPEKRLNNEKMFSLIANAVKYDGISLVVLDNLMSINNEMSEGDQYQKQEKFVKRCQALAKKYNVAVVIVAHMKKPNKEGKVNEYQMFGSSTIPNYMDNIFYVRKANESDTEKYKSSLVNGIIEILKNREESELKEILLTFEKKTKMLFEINIANLNKQFPILIDFGLKKYLNNQILEKKEAEKKQSFFSQLGLGELENV